MGLPLTQGIEQSSQWNGVKLAYGGRAGAGSTSHLDVLMADLTHLSQEGLQFLPQLPVMAWGVPSLI